MRTSSALSSHLKAAAKCVGSAQIAPDGHLHQWQATVCNRSNNSGCPYCSGQAVCSHNSLAQKAPHIAKDWDFDRNPDSPQEYTVNSSQRVHWICPQDHQWQAIIGNRTRVKTGCPTSAKLKGNQQQPVLTASSSSVMQFWDWEQNAKEGLDPNKLTCGSHKPAHFKCNKCSKLQPHRWTAWIQNVVRTSGCPFCTGQRVCKCNSLQTPRPYIAAEWCYAKNQGTPDDYTSRSHTQTWWENDKRGVWKARVYSRSANPPKPEVQIVHCLSHLIITTIIKPLSSQG